MSYKRIIITRFGDSEVLKMTEEAILSEPKPGQVRVSVLATSANFTDVMIRKGLYRDVKMRPPTSPGYDMVGVVDALGDGAARFRVGQKVADLTVIGAYSEYICLPESRLVPVPDGLDPADAVSLIVSYVTAYQMLYRAAKVQKGWRIVIHGAGGAVGTAILQLGGLLGLEMYGTDVRTKHELIKGLGAIPIDYQAQDFDKCIWNATSSGMDAIFDPIGGKPSSYLLTCSDPVVCWLRMAFIMRYQVKEVVFRSSYYDSSCGICCRMVGGPLSILSASGGKNRRIGSVKTLSNCSIFCVREA